MPATHVVIQRAARARNQAADVVERLGAKDSEIVARIALYREVNTLTGRNTEHVVDDLPAAAFDLIEDLSEEVDQLKRAKTKAS